MAKKTRKLSERLQSVKDIITSLTDRIRNAENWIRHTNPNSASTRKVMNKKRATLKQLRKWRNANSKRLKDMQSGGRKQTTKTKGES